MRVLLVSVLALLAAAAPASAAEWRRASLITPPFTEVPEVLTSVSDAGETQIVWKDSEFLLYRTRVRGEDAGPPEQLAVDVSRTYTMAADRQGNAVVAWVASGGGSDSAVVARFRPAGGRFGDPQIVALGENQASQLKVALAPTGEAVIAWRDLGAGPGQRRLRTAARPAVAAGFEPAQTLATGAPVLRGLGIDDEGNSVIAWSDGPAVRAAMRVRGGAFASPTTLTSTNREFKGELEMKVSTLGFVVLAFTEGPQDGRTTSAHVTIAVGDSQFGSWEHVRVASGPFASDLTVDAWTGYGAVIWRAASGRRSRVQAAPVTQGIPDPTQTVSGRNARRPDITIAGDGRFTAVWQRLTNRGRAIEATSRAGAQERFPAPERLSSYGDVSAPALEANVRGEQFAAWIRSGRGLSRAESAKASSQTGRFSRALTIFDGRTNVGETVDRIRLEPADNVMQAVYRRELRGRERLFWDLSTYGEPAP